MSIDKNLTNYEKAHVDYGKVIKYKNIVKKYDVYKNTVYIYRQGVLLKYETNLKKYSSFIVGSNVFITSIKTVSLNLR